MTTIRAFIAIHLPPEVQAALGQVAATLGEGLPHGAVRWVRPELMHLTLRFLGDTDVGKLPAIGEAMGAATAGRAPFTLTLDSLGCFPNPRRPRVVGAELGGDTAQLLALKAALDAQLAALSWPLEDKPFRAHLTLGRVKDERTAQSLSLTVPLPQLAVPVAAIYLMESQLRPDGPIYTVRHSLALGG